MLSGLRFNFVSSIAHNLPSNLQPRRKMSICNLESIIASRHGCHVRVRTTAGPPEALGPTLRTTIAALDPRIRVTDVMDLSEVGWEARTFLSGAGGVLALLGGLALLLSLAGVYALASLAVTSRTKEIGIRLALGATTQQVLAPVLGRTTLQLGLGTGAGIALAMVVARVLDSLPFAIPMSIGIAVPAAAALLLAAGIVASWLPARRAMKIDPVHALRAD